MLARAGRAAAAAMDSGQAVVWKETRRGEERRVRIPKPPFFGERGGKGEASAGGSAESQRQWGGRRDPYCPTSETRQALHVSEAEERRERRGEKSGKEMR